jgi:hypothetical protein
MTPRPAEFLTDLRALDIAEGTEVKRFQLLAAFRVYSAVLQDTLEVPEGFVSDGESIPSIVAWIAPPFGQSKRGAFVHDYLYRNGGYYRLTGEFVPVTRKRADQVYLELVKLKGLSSWRSYTRYAVLRLVGWHAYRPQPPPHDATHPALTFSQNPPR